MTRRHLTQRPQAIGCRLSCGRRAFTIVEIVVVTGMLGVFLMLVGQMTVSLTHATGRAQSAEEALIRMDNVVRLLRRDVWSAQSVEVKPAPADGGAAPAQWIILQQSDGAITWEYNRDTQRLLRRGRPDDDSAPPQVWRHFPLDIRFAADGPSLLVTLPRGAMSSGDELRLPSQTMLLRPAGAEQPDGGVR